MNAVSGVGSILLHADAASACITRFELALDLVARLDAELTVAFGAAPQERATSAYSAAAAVDAAAVDAAGHELAKHRLRTHRALQGCEPRWCDIAGESVIRGFLAEAVYADLLVIGQGRALAEPGSSPRGFTESVILESSKPSLVIPLQPRHPTVGRRALVAWNGSIQAARALTGALPLLRIAEEVHLVSWAAHMPAAPFSGTDVREFLRRHGIDVRMHQEPAASRVDVPLASLAHELRSDVLVMGCYGRNRLSERVFGGTTHSVLATTDVAVLMAH